MLRTLIAIATACFAGLALPQVAMSDSTPIPATQDLPWTDPSHQSSLEVLAGQIASKIANRQVAVRCEGDTDWKTLTIQRNVDSAGVAGYVDFQWAAGGSTIATFAQLSPGTCWNLQQFALANPKPTECPSTVERATTTYVIKRIAVRRRVVLNGKAQVRVTWQSRSVPVTTTTSVAGPPVPCPALDPMKLPADYKSYAEAILTLAHEAVHLGGFVGGTTTNGLALGDVEAEAIANCYGIQWMWWVATQLGDNPTDAQSIATWAYQIYYPGYKNAPGASHYWSADCVPNGRFDIRSDKTTAWPAGGSPIEITGAPYHALPASSHISACWVTDQDSWNLSDQVSRTATTAPALYLVTKLKAAPSADTDAVGTVTGPTGSSAYTTNWTWSAKSDTWRFGVQWTNVAKGNYTFGITLGDGSTCQYNVAFTG